MNPSFDLLLDFRIEVANLDGSDRKVLIQEDLPHPFGLTLLGDYIYWTDWTDIVERADKYTGKDRELIAVHLLNPMGIKASVTSQSLEKFGDQTNECSVNNGGCSHLCLWTPNGRQCACPNEFDLSNEVDCVKPEAFLLYVSKGNINWASLKNNKIPPQAINNLDRSVNVDSIAGDFDSKSVYWTDIQNGAISRNFINGSKPEVLIELGLKSPNSLAIDNVAQNMYWTDAGLNRIEVARLDGSFRKALIWENLDNPASIAVDPSRGSIFWASWGNQTQIETAGLDGSKRKVFVPEGKIFYHLLVLFFVLASHNSVLKYNNHCC